MVDANTVLSALISGSKTFDVFLANKRLKRFEFIAPEFLFLEVGRHFDEILERSRLSPEELAKVFKLIKEEIKFVPFEEFNEHANEAEKVSPHTKDVQYFALALAFDCGIWSKEKAFKDQSRVRVFSTLELIGLLEPRASPSAHANIL
ncbi:MAG: PIN domain-containing protein [Candidatus Hadarchaeota archaeon]